MSLKLLATVSTGALLSISCATTASAAGGACDNRSNNTIKKLLECVTVENVRGHQAAFQAIADANGGIRASGTPGYDASGFYVGDALEAAGYTVEYQPFAYSTYREFNAELEQLSPTPTVYVNGTDYDGMAYSGSGEGVGAIEAVDLDLGLGNTSTSGCEASDFAGFTAGNVALIQRGACSFAQKAINADAAGAVGAIIFNQGNTAGRQGLLFGTLGEGTVVGIPVMGTTYDLGLSLLDASASVRILVDSTTTETETFNVIADSPYGDPNNVIIAGGHLDSVDEGPGIQDNGSGTAALLEVALKMAKVETVNKVRFAFWGGEEAGLIGSDSYVFDPEIGLTQEEYDAITLYLNFDMIGSPNYFFGIYDGNGDAFGLPGPAGSAEIEATFEQYYTAVGEPFEASDFSGRSDYAAFIQVGIPAGGLFTGAEGIKTPDQVAIYGGIAGEQYDPCYHLACDTFDNISLKALDVNSDAVAYATLKYSMSTETINGIEGKGNFKQSKLDRDAGNGNVFEWLADRQQR